MLGKWFKVLRKDRDSIKKVRNYCGGNNACFIKIFY